MNEKDLKQLKKDIGVKLFNKLSKEDRDWIIKVEGSIDFGHPLGSKELRRMFKSIAEYKDNHDL